MMLGSKRQLLILIGLVLLTTGAGCSLLPSEEVDAPPPLLSPPEARTITYTVERGYFASELGTLGRVAAVRESTLYFRRSGRVRQLLVEPGDVVEAGQVLARLETGDLEHRLKLAQVDLELAEMEYQRAKSLLGLEISPHEMKMKELAKQKTVLEVERLEDELEASTIRSPFDGRVVSVYARERDAVEAYRTVVKVAVPV